MKKESDYLVRNPKAIADHLGEINSKKCLISAHFGEHNASFLTAIIELDYENGIVKLDRAPTELLDRQLLNADRIVFRTDVEGIKASFGSKNVKHSQSAGHPTYDIPFPSSMFWMQRRLYYRVKVPLSHAGSVCEIILSTGESHARTATFRLSDISICGFSLLIPDHQFAGHFQQDLSINQCTLYLQDSGYADVGIVVKDVTPVQLGSSHTQQRIGCLITNVPAAFESKIQLYMQNIERQLRKIGR